MGGGLMQLVAYGAQDVYLSGNPQITFFKVVYRRHTNFSVEPIQQTWNGSSEFGKTVTCNINRNGDLITNMYVVVALNPTTGSSIPWGYVSKLGHALISNVKIEIGGSKIDEQYGEWLNIWYELTHKAGQERGYAKMIGDIPELTNITTTAKKAYKLYIPLQFWFNRNNGLALPLIALQYHDVRITVVFRSAEECINWKGGISSPPSSTERPAISDSYLLIDYVYLDSEERKRFAQASHEYLIEQLQFTGSEALASTGKYRLNFNHPSKYLVWVPHFNQYLTRNEWLAYAHDGNWETARERFAKLLYLATRSSISSSATSTVAPSSISSPLYVNKGSVIDATSAGDLFEPDTILPIDPNVLSLLRKIEVKLVAQADVTSGQLNALIAEGGATTLDELLTQIINNTVVTRNDLTIEDVSKTIAQLPGLNSFIVSLGRISAMNIHNYGNFVDGSDNPVINSKLQLNGHDRFQARDGNYFNYVQPYQHFSNTPSDGVNVYSFALKAEDHQPTGTCNFSRIDNATLQVDLGMYNNISTDTSRIVNGSLLNIYTVNYNVLRVMSGMAGTAYSN
jgi:hypothetical protein